MPARDNSYTEVYEMPVDTLLPGASPPGLGHCFPSNPGSLFCHRLPMRNGFSMGVGRKGDLLEQLQRDNIHLPLRSCIKVRTPLNESTAFNSCPSSKCQRKSLEAPRSAMKNGVRSPGNCNGCTVTPVQSKSGASQDLCSDKKRVSFADSKGFSLHTVKYVDGPSNMPPTLHIHHLQDVIQNEEAKPTHPYVYDLEFEQPASNYLEFRDRLEKECVCLENVMIKDNILLVGTIKVKNIDFEKCVQVRISFDKWKTHRDFKGEYVFPTQASNSPDKYDTFSFRVDIPPNLGGQCFEFCICYTALHQTFWDNNRGNNYRIVTEKEMDYAQKVEQKSYDSLSGNYSWGQFSYWHMGHEESPYW